MPRLPVARCPPTMPAAMPTSPAWPISPTNLPWPYALATRLVTSSYRRSLSGAHPPGTTTASKSSADTSFAATSLVASRACFPRTVWPGAIPTTVTSAPSSRRRMTVTQNSRSSNPSARNTATLRPDNR